FPVPWSVNLLRVRRATALVGGPRSFRTCQCWPSCERLRARCHGPRMVMSSFSEITQAADAGFAVGRNGSPPDESRRSRHARRSRADFVGLIPPTGFEPVLPP